MAERKVQATPFVTTFDCEQPNCVGTYMATGHVKQSGKADAFAFLHKCDKCGHMRDLPKAYPILTHKTPDRMVQPPTHKKALVRRKN